MCQCGHSSAGCTLAPPQRPPTGLPRCVVRSMPTPPTCRPTAGFWGQRGASKAAGGSSLSPLCGPALGATSSGCHQPLQPAVGTQGTPEPLSALLPCSTELCSQPAPGAHRAPRQDPCQAVPAPTCSNRSAARGEGPGVMRCLGAALVRAVVGLGPSLGEPSGFSGSPLIDSKEQTL